MPSLRRVRKDRAQTWSTPGKEARGGGYLSRPLAVLSLGTFRMIDDDRAIRWSMWSGVLVLFLTPLVWFTPTTSCWGRTLLASLVGGCLGMALISLKVVLH